MSTVKSVRVAKKDAKPVFEAFAELAESKISEDDLAALSALVGLELEDDFYMAEKTVCRNCGKELSFYDMAKTSLDQNIHTMDFIRDLLSGNEVVIVKAEPREINCTRCGTENIAGGYICATYVMW